MEEWYREASRLLDKARSLTNDEFKAFKYFMENVSAGTLRAEEDLARKGINNPKRVIERLVNLGLIEKGEYSYSLSRPLRMLRARRGRIQL